jgi:hypothetical protein
MRFSLRSLLAAVTLICVILAAWLAYRRETYCQLRWLSPNSKEASSLFPKPAPEQLSDGSYRLTYYVRNRDVQSLLRNVKEPDGSSYNMLVDRETVILNSDDLPSIQRYLQAIQVADVKVPKAFLIRGRVVDRKGKAVPHATVDLMGDFVFINHFETRDDGTFTMSLRDGAGNVPPARGGYYLRIRPRGDSVKNPLRWNSTNFSLDVTQPERDVIVALPESLDD